MPPVARTRHTPDVLVMLDSGFWYPILSCVPTLLIPLQADPSVLKIRITSRRTPLAADGVLDVLEMLARIG
ncbi:hypothetical protein BDN71DRAFT_1446420, partial [Pleurotus eryngii]